MYRTGNFGEKYGKVNTDRGKKWVAIHTFLTSLMLVFTCLGMLKMKHLSDLVTYKKYLVTLPCLCTVSDVFTCIFAAFFMWQLQNLSNPYRSYIILRVLAFIDVVLNINFIIVGSLLTLIVKEQFTVSAEDYWLGGESYMVLQAKMASVTKTYYAIITVLMIVKVFVAHSYVFSWWGYLPGFPSLCVFWAPCCIMEESSGALAPGAENSPPQIQNTAGQMGAQTQGINQV